MDLKVHYYYWYSFPKVSKQTLKIMKLIPIILVAACIQVSARGYSQITLSETNTPLQKVFQEIQQQSGYDFVSTYETLKEAGNVTLDVRNVSLQKALEECLKGKPLTYKIIGRTVVIQLKEKDSYNASNKTVALKPLTPPIEIHGRVVNQHGEPLHNVTVLIAGTKIGTATDNDGRFTLSSPDNRNIVLKISSVGFETKAVKVGQQTEINVTLEEANTGLNEVVVVGYGTQRKSDLTGSVGSINNKELTERPAITTEQLLAGKIAGVNVATNSGRPGGRTRVAIRGFSSINASNDPLYIVDGIVSPNGIENLDPNNIESINVLKDASSTAIYGTRGTNGVIIVTTKRGKEGKAQISYDSYVSLNWLPSDRKLKPLNSNEFLQIEELQYQNASKFDSAGFANGKYKDPIAKRMNYLVGNTLGNRELFKLDNNNIPQPLYNIDWQDMSTRKSISNSHNLSITGGDKLTNYGFFLGYINDNGIIKESFAKRYNIRAVLDRQIKSWLKMGGTFSYSVLNQSGVNDNNGSYDVIRYMLEFVPFIPYKYANGTYGNSGDYQGLERVDNPLAQIKEITRNYHSSVFQGNTYANVKLFKGLEFTSTLGVNTLNNYDPYFRSSLLVQNRSQANISTTVSNFWEWSNRLNYEKQINENQKINVLAGTELQGYNLLNWLASTENLSDNYYQFYNLGSGASPLAPASSSTSYKMQSYFSRLNYSLKDKYLFTATGRVDGSSRFGLNNKFAFFPSAAIAWKISQENFLKNNESISNLKIRASFGLTGNSEIGSYRSQANLITNAYPINGNRAAGTAIGTLANPDLRWEKTAQFDVGLNLGLFNNRINVEADFFQKNTHDLLLDAPVPATSGYTIVTRNVGSMVNKGFELSLNTINIDKRNFTWSTTFNFSSLKNRVTALGAKNEDIIYGFKNLLLLRVGQSVGSFYGYVRDGIWGTNEKSTAASYGKLPGDLKILDLNKDGVINGKDQTIIGKGIPDFYGTLSNEFRYKNFNLILELQYSEGNDVFDNSRNSGEARQGIANSYATVLDAWTPANQNATLEQVRPTGAGYAYYMDTRKLQNGSFIRGKNLLLGYTIPKGIISKLGLTNCKFYLSAQNLFLITKYSGYDPEVSNYDNDVFSQGVNYASYPKARTLTLGVNLSF
jgi:TonB-linked SusC/RagA family outer membrane protein